MFKKMTFLILTTTALFAAGSEIFSSKRGIEISDAAGSYHKIEDVQIGGLRYKRLILPDNYSPSTDFPSTETFERIYTFAVPEGALPTLSYRTTGTQYFSTAGLVPSKSFIPGPGGISAEKYVIPEERADTEKEHAGIVRFGHYEGMELYRLILRPLVIKGKTAEFAGRTDISIRFSKEFESEPADVSDIKSSFLKSVVNAGYAKADPARLKKTKEPCFLDIGTERIKVKVKDDGIYRISGAALRSLGLDLSAVMCSRIKVYSSAGKDLDNNPEASPYHGAQEIGRRVIDTNSDGYFNDNDYIIFYAASALTRDGSAQSYYYNKYSGHTYYWIDLGTDSPGNGKDMQPAALTGTEYSQEISVFTKHVFNETRNENYYLDYNYFLWYGKSIEPFSTHSVSFSFRNMVQTDSVLIRVRNSNEILSNSARIEYTINSEPGSLFSSVVQTAEHEFDPSFFIPDGENVLSMKNASTSIPKYYNGYEVLYSAAVEASATDEYFYAEGTPGVRTRMNLGSSAGKDIYDISDPYNVRYSNLSGDYCIADIDSVRSYLLFSGTYKNPVSLSVYDNRNSPSLHSVNRTADMVIIAPDEFISFFKNDGDGREYINTHVNSYDNGVNSIALVSIDSLSNEFGRGYQEPAATRNFIRYAHENWGSEYFILAGDGNYYIYPENQSSEKNLIYPADPNYISFFGRGSDDFYANLSSLSYAQHVSLGRFPASNISELRNIVVKTTDFMKNGNIDNQRSKILLVGDDERSLNGDGTWAETFHIGNTERYIADSIPDYYYTDKLYMTEYPFEYSAATGLYLKPKAEQDLIRKLNGGVNIFCYIGHGAPMQLAHEKLFTTSTFSKVYNPDRYYFMLGATCKFGVFNDIGIKYLAEQMLLSPGKGSIGLINSVSDVFSTSNEKFFGSILSSAFRDELSKLTIGQALKEGKNDKPESGNSARFMLLGDPALKLFGDKKIVRSHSSVELFTLRPDSILSTLDMDTAGITGNNGTLNTVIVDSEVRRAYYNSDQWPQLTYNIDTLRYTLPGKIILSARSEMQEGSSVTRFILPKDLTYGDNKGRVHFYGRNTDGIEFTGSIDSVSIKGDPEASVTDSIPPSIKVFFNSENYIEGDPIGQSPVIYARIEDENGINTSGGIGHKIIMEVDGNPVDVTPNFSYDLNSYQSGAAFYQFVDLSAGSHIIKVSAWDNFNNYNETVQNFTTVNESTKNGKWIGNLLNHPNPVKSSGTTFGFSVNLPSDLISYSVSIYTINGRKVKTLENLTVDYSDQFQSLFWNGRDADGDIPANGVYIYILRARFNDGKTVTKKGRLIFAR
ncbi:MAG TPA: type IX secretion system sortase PorU [Clostridiales bacterium]|nr:type IX secretion system sortase PorU [Clostridiales bacterium]